MSHSKHRSQFNITNRV